MDINSIPRKPGVYLMKNSAGKILYIGKANNLFSRVSAYFSGAPKSQKINLLINNIREIDYIVAASGREALLIEDKLIKKYQPFYNTLLRDDKSYPYLKITKSEKYPKLLIARNPSKNKRPGDRFYGPYPQTPQLKKLSVWLTRTFGLRPCKYELSGDKSKYLNCIYLQTGKCPAPCVGKISPRNYARNVAALSDFLRGRYGAIEKQLMARMKTLSAKMDYEKAAKLRDILNSIRTMHDKIRFGQIEIKDIDDAAQQTEKLRLLKETLGLSRFPATIECFDISNIGSAYPVGSTVRFHLGIPDKANYRKYKIRYTRGQNDFAMMSEVVERRCARLLREEPSKMPDLIVIDGGKGHLNAALDALKRLNLTEKIDVISIAKSAEYKDEIYTARSDSPLKIPRDSKALHLLQQIRDEAHRFAISYHRLLRGRTFKPCNNQR